MDPARDHGAGRGSALRARLRRWLRPPRTLRPTRAGWSFFAITFGVGFAAFNTGNNLLYLVLALMLAFLVLSGVLSESALRGIEVRRRLPRELFAGVANPVALEICNRQRRVPSFAIVVEDRVAGAKGPRAAGRAFCLRIGAGETERRSYRLRPERRGPLRFVGFEVFTRFPFGLFSKALTIEMPEEVLVYPEVEAVRMPPELGAARGGGEWTNGAGGSGAEVSGLREYALGDAFRRIHWRSSLRSGELLVRDVESESQAEIEVRLRTAGARPGALFEQSVSAAASEVLAHLDGGARVSLVTDAERLAAAAGPHQRGRLLGFLALVEPDGTRAEAA